MAKFIYNDSIHASTRVTPFYANTGRHPASNIIIEQSGTLLTEPIAIAHADKMLEFYKKLKEEIAQAQAIIAQYYNQNWADIEFQPGELV